MDIPKIKKMISEPKIYAIMVRSMRGQALHIGVYFTLEEAYSSARKQLESFSPHFVGEAVDIDLWNSIPIRQALTGAIGEEIIETTSSEPQNNFSSGEENILNDEVINNLFGLSLKKDKKELPNNISSELKPPKPIEKPLLNTTSLTIEEQILSIKKIKEEIVKQKNTLMKDLIRQCDIQGVEKLKTLLGANAYRYVIEEIKRLPLSTRNRLKKGSVDIHPRQDFKEDNK